MKNPLRLIAAALAACTAVAAHADNDEANPVPADIGAVARQACTDAAKARGIEVAKVERTKFVALDRYELRLQTEKNGVIECAFEPRTGTATLLGFADRGKAVGEGPLVKICEQVADQQRIRLGRFDELKPLPGRRYEVRFDRAFFVGSRHTCIVDQAQNVVSFDGGKPVPLPGTAPAKK